MKPVWAKSFVPVEQWNDMSQDDRQQELKGIKTRVEAAGGDMDKYSLSITQEGNKVKIYGYTSRKK